MARNGSGIYSLPAGNPVVSGSTISSNWANNTLSDIATALTGSLAKDGQTVPTANIPMGGFKLTGLAAATAYGDAVRIEQLQNSDPLTLSSVSGTNTITGNLTPAITSYVAGQTFRFVASGANTGAVTININGLGAKAVTKAGAVALVSGDIPSGAAVQVFYDGTQFQLTIISAAASGANSDITSLSGLTTPLSVAQGGTGSTTGISSTQIQPISASVAASALTISSSALSLDFRSTNLGSGAVTTVTGTPANLVVPSTATLGTVSAAQSRLVVLALNNAGTIELAVVNIAGGNDLTETGLISTTAISAAATSASVVYSTTARTSVAYRVLGYVESTQSTAGTWATAPSTIQGAGGQALTAMSSLGYGQTWQNVTGSRAVSTNYYNTTGKPITVCITANSSAVASFSMAVNSANILSTSVPATYNASGTVVVPPGNSYAFSIGSITSFSWFELR